VSDVYPAYITWETFERIQAMLHDTYAEYERTQTRGIPRAGAALLQGMLYCGECGHKLAVQYKGGTHDVCNALRQRYRAPVCQYIPADPVDLGGVEAFFQAFAPIELGRLGLVRSPLTRRPSSRCERPMSSICNDSITRQPWPSGSSYGSTPTIAWWPPS